MSKRKREREEIASDLARITGVYGEPTIQRIEQSDLGKTYYAPIGSSLFGQSEGCY